MSYLNYPKFVHLESHIFQKTSKMGQKKIFFLDLASFFPYFDPRMVNIHCIIFCHLEENLTKQKDMKNFGYKYFFPPPQKKLLNMVTLKKSM